MFPWEALLQSVGRADVVVLQDYVLADRLAVHEAAWQQAWRRQPAGDGAGEATARCRPGSAVTVTEVHESIPHRARLHVSVTCEAGGAAMETRVRKLGGRDLCSCFERECATC